VKVVLISGSEDGAMAELARQAQVDAFVNKRNMHQELVPTVRRLAAG
jgi:DNA-binding NarL/FixJ family response regulator